MDEINKFLVVHLLHVSGVGDVILVNSAGVRDIIYRDSKSQSTTIFSW